MIYPALRDPYIQFLRDEAALTGTPFYQSFGCYSQINNKSANLTPQDIFTKQLLMVKQLTVEKAIAITQKFPSILSLWKLYQSLPDERSREHYFKDWMASSSQRKFGLVLSRRLYKIFCSDYRIDNSL